MNVVAQKLHKINVNGDTKGAGGALRQSIEEQIGANVVHKMDGNAEDRNDKKNPIST